MKNAIRAGAVLVAVLAFGPLAVAQADEAAQWFENGVKITSAKAYSSEGSFEIEDTGLGYKARCLTLEKGKVGALAAGTIESITSRSGEKVIACENNNEAACHGTVTMEAVHLPWSTTLSRVGTEIRNKVSNGGSGEPEWVLQCKSETEKSKENCNANTEATVENKSGGTVEALLEDLPNGQPCTTKKLIVRNGVEVVKLSSGAKLRVGPEGPGWMINGGQLKNAVTVVTKGRLTISDPGMVGSEQMARGQAMECATTGEELVGSGNLGEITHLTFSGCTSLHSGKKGLECSETEASAKMSAKHLPWLTQLVTSGGTTRQMVYEGSGGVPGWAMECKLTDGLKATDECSGKTSAGVSNVSGGVDETFEAKSEKLKCSLTSSTEGTIEGTQLLENPASGTLTF